MITLNKTQEVVLYIVNLIKSEKVKTNEILPSEQFLMVKFNCSRITVTAAYSRLKSLGAIYSINKRGHFVAENFYSAIAPISNNIDPDNSKITKNDLPEPSWFKEFKIKFDYGYASYVKKYYKKRKLVMEAEYYISIKYEIDNIEKIYSIIEHLQEEYSIINNVVYKLRYENIKKWGYSKLVVVYMFGYDTEGIMISAKYVIHPDDFAFFKQEFSIL